MNNNSLKYLIFGGLFLVPFVPLIIASSLFFPFITGKAFVFRLLVEIVFAAYLILAIRDETYRPKFSWVMGAVVVFLFAIGLADIFAENPFKAFWSNYERMEGYVLLLHLGAYFLVMSSVLKTQELWSRLLATSLFGSLVMSVYSLFQIAGKVTINQGGVRVDGTLGNAAYLGIYMVFHIFFAALLFTRSKESWQKIVLTIVAVLNLIVLYHTATRGAILGFLGGAMVTFIFLVIKSEKGAKIRKVAGVGAIALIAVIGLFVTIRNTSFVQESPVLARFAELSPSEFQTQGRYYVWPMAIKGFIERPILGWGQEGFNFVFNKYYDPKMYTQEPWFDRAHNTFLDWLVAGGALGLLSYISILLSLVYYIFKAKDDFLKKEDKAIMLGVLSAYTFNNLFVFDQISSYILFFTIVAYIHAHAPEADVPLWQKISLKFRNVIKDERHHSLVEASVVIVSILIFYFVVFAPWRHNRGLLEVLKVNNSGQIATLEVYTGPIKKYNIGFPEGLEHISQTVIALSANPNASAELKQGLFDAVDQAFARQIQKVPNDARYRLFYGLFLSRFGWYGRAIEQLEEARKLSPNKQAIYFELANNYLMDNKPQKASEMAKTAYDLAPTYHEASLVYGYVALSSGDTRTGNQILSQIDQNQIIFDDRYLNILLSLGQNEKIIEVAKKRVELDSQNRQNWITLAAAYLQSNRREEAIDAIEGAIKIDPAFKEQGELYIKEIRAGRNP